MVNVSNFGDRATLRLYLARAAFGKAERIEDTGAATASEVVTLYDAACAKLGIEPRPH